jgi:hypothetical protein
LIVDSLTILGTSISGYELRAEELLASMDSNGIDKSVVVPVQPKTYRLEPQNEAIAVTQSRYPDRFIVWSERRVPSAYPPSSRPVILG